MERAARNAAWTENGGELIRLADFIEAYKGSKASLKEDDLEYYNHLFKKFQ